MKLTNGPVLTIDTDQGDFTSAEAIAISRGAQTCARGGQSVEVKGARLCAPTLDSSPPGFAISSLTIPSIVVEESRRCYLKTPVFGWELTK